MKKKHHCADSGQVFYIREHSFIARVAAYKLGAKRVAIVLGHTIHLWNSTEMEFLKNDRWLRHELAHIRQYNRYGFLKFIILYLTESIRRGYQNNRFELEARQAEEQH